MAQTEQTLTGSARLPRLLQEHHCALPVADATPTASPPGQAATRTRRDKMRLMPASPRDVLAYSKTIAVVGASKDSTKPGATIPMALQRHGFRIIPVNPTADILFGERAYKRLADIPERVDVVNVFRPADEAPTITEQAVAIGARAVWLQTGITSSDARRLAEAAGLDFVEDHCIAVERAKFSIEVR